MSTSRLLVLYPYIFKRVKIKEPSIELGSPLTLFQQHAAGFKSATKSRQEHYAQRYGPAKEPYSPPLSGELSDLVSTGVIPAQKDDQKQAVTPSLSPENASTATKKDADTSPERRPSSNHKTKSGQSASLDAAESHPEELGEVPLRGGADKPLEKVLHMEPPTVVKEDHKPPHLHAPPYVHHFDTFSLVRDLQTGGFTQDQSVTIMKAVRSLLAVNLDMAREGLVSKSDIENETYLFRAACSELRTEIQNSRKATSEKLRTDRAHLQHEVDILNQKLTQESLTLNDELRGMFDDRKMSVKMEQRGMESAIQELNYKITVALNSDSRGEVEGLRWVLTRRAALAIAVMAFLILGSLRYSTYKIHLQDREQQQRRAVASAGSSDSRSPRSGSSSDGNASRDLATQTADSDTMLANVNSGANPSYVSLG